MFSFFVKSIPVPMEGDRMTEAFVVEFQACLVLENHLPSNKLLQK